MLWFLPSFGIAGASGPAQCVEHIKRVKALEHFTFLAQLQHMYLMKPVSGGLEAVRPIGQLTIGAPERLDTPCPSHAPNT